MAEQLGEDQEQKWDSYFAEGNIPPWESGKPSSHVCDYCKQHDVTGLRIIDIGCGSGVNLLHFWKAGCAQALGIDISEHAIKRAIQSAKARRCDNRISFTHANIFPFSETDEFKTEIAGQFDVLFDCQTFHALRDQGKYPQIMLDCLRPGGQAIVLAGNSTEPARHPGPPVLSATEMVSPFEAVGFRVINLTETRFDPTPVYGESPPLAWLLRVQKP